MKNLIQKLGEAIHERLRIGKHRRRGQEHPRPGLRRHAHAGSDHRLNQVETESDEAAQSAHEDPLGAFTRDDLTFLKSLRITLPEEEEVDLESDPPDDSSEGSSAEAYFRCPAPPRPVAAAGPRRLASALLPPATKKNTSAK